MTLRMRVRTSVIACLFITVCSSVFAEGLADLQTLHQTVDSNYSKREELLHFAHGKALMEWKATTPAQAGMNGSSPQKFKPLVGSWNTEWWTKGDKYRYDVESGKPSPEAEKNWVFRLPHNVRVAADNESSIYYHPIYNEATYGHAIKRRGNPYGLHRSFRIDYCYDAGPAGGYRNLLSESC